jgi:uncharacterized membrane protein YeaQ/YmgE (transglycosylase-associated protein family)
VAAFVAAQLWNGGEPIGIFTPAMCGLVAAVVAFAAAGLIVPNSGSTSPARAGS